MENEIKQKKTPQERYIKKYIIRYVFVCNKKTESELIEKINSINNKSGYIKELIKTDTEIFKKYLKKEKSKMKKQWIEFLESKPLWSYNIVPSLVDALDSACKNNDTKKVNEILDSLATQGIILDKGNLKYWTENLID